MQIAFTPGSVLLLAMIAQGVFAAALLLVRRENRRANRLLAALVVLLAMWLCDAFFNVSGLYAQQPDFYFLPIYYSLGFGPLLYFYTRALTRADFRLRTADLPHFLPVLLQFLFYVYLQARDYAFRREFWFEVHRPYTYDLELMLSFASLLVYLLAGRRLVRRFRRSLADHYSNLQYIALRWLDSLYGVLAVLAVFWCAESFGRLVLGSYPATPLSYVSVGFTLLFLAAGGILQRDLSGIAAAVEEKPTPQSTTEEATGDAAATERLRAVMENERLYLEQELTLAQFAARADLPPREVSRIINRGDGSSFIDFVNGYRVEHCKRLLRDDRLAHLSLLGIALESGFNSKATFNRVFKKREGISPSQFKRGLNA